MKKLIPFLLLLMALGTQAQETSFDFALAAKKGISPAISYDKLYSVGPNKRINIGWGLRATTYFQGETKYLTAPAKLTSGKQSIVAFFTPYREDYIDTLTLNKTAIASLNAKIILGYRLTKKINLGFSIDALGFTIGSKQSGSFEAQEAPQYHLSTQEAKPTVFNALLISDSDLGSLNSDLFLSYKLNESSGLRLGLAFQFVEYTTTNKLSFNNDRFRYKTLMPFIAYSVKLRKK